MSPAQCQSSPDKMAMSAGVQHPLRTVGDPSGCYIHGWTHSHSAPPSSCAQDSGDSVGASNAAGFLSRAQSPACFSQGRLREKSPVLTMHSVGITFVGPNVGAFELKSSPFSVQFNRTPCHADVLDMHPSVCFWMLALVVFACGQAGHRSCFRC